MTLKLYTLRGKVTGSLYYAEAHTKNHAAQQLGIRPSLLILERSQKVKTEGVQLVQDPSISSNTVPYHSPRQ